MAFFSRIVQRGVRLRTIAKGKKLKGLVGDVGTEEKVEKHQRAIAVFSRFEYVRSALTNTLAFLLKCNAASGSSLHTRNDLREVIEGCRLGENTRTSARVCCAVR